MNNSEKYFKEFINKQIDEISFVDLKKDAKIRIGEKEYTANSEFPIPIREKNLLKDIKNQDNYDGVSIKNIIDGIIYIYGTDSKFKYSDKYDDILEALGIDVESFIIYNINSFDDSMLNESLVYANALINKIQSAKTCFIYANVLEKSYYHIQDKAAENTEEAIIVFNEMIKYYEKAIDYDEAFNLAYYKLGYIYKQCGQYIRAKLYWEKQQKLDDDSIRVDEIRKNLEDMEVLVEFETGKNLILEGHAEAGIEKLLPLVENFSSWWDLLFFVGLGYRQIESYEVALRYFENALMIRNEDKLTLNEIGLCRLNLERYEEARDVFTNLLSLDPNNCEILCNRAVAKYHLYDDEGARNDVRLALKIDEEDEVANNLSEFLNQ